MTPALRKLNLTAHVATSVGWLGAVAGFLALSIGGLISQDAEMVRGAYLAMNRIGQYVIVPLSLAALLTGVVQSLGTQWGLVRYYWVLVKFALTVGATILLLLHQFTAVAAAARRASGAAAGTLPEVDRLGTQLVGDAGFAVLVLLMTTTLSVYKPWGRTPFGRQQRNRPAVPRGSHVSDQTASVNLGDEATVERVPLGLTLLLIVACVIAALFVVVHLTGHAPMSHIH